METQQRYRRFIDSFEQFHREHKVGGTLIVFLTNMGIWNIAAQFTDDAYVSSFYVHVAMSVFFTAVFYVGARPSVEG